MWRFVCYAAVAMLGYLITVLYYRMNKPAKLAVSIGVPVFFVIVLPAIDFALFSGSIYHAIGVFVARARGFLNGSNPYIGMLSGTLLFIIFAELSYLTLRKATVKE